MLMAERKTSAGINTCLKKYVLTTLGKKNNAKLGVLCEQVFAFTIKNTSGRS